MSRIYIASSWKNEAACRGVASRLRDQGHKVDCFCDPWAGRYVFHWTELVEKQEDLAKYDAVNFLADSRVQRAFLEDKKWLDWADTVLLILPCGRSAHLEAGYGKGSGKRLFIYGDFVKGEFDVMYGFADGLFRTTEVDQLCEALKAEAEKPEAHRQEARS